MSHHKTLATELLDHQFNDPRNHSNAAGQSATVHAILYLAEQQRIANLIALGRLADDRYGVYAGEGGSMATLFDNPIYDGGNMCIRDDIREGLGL